MKIFRPVEAGRGPDLIGGATIAKQRTNTMEAKLDIKTKFAIGSAVVAFLAGWGLTIAGFIIPPKGEVHDSVLWILGQALIYAASVFGVGMYISSEMTKLRTENRNYIERALKEEKEAEQHED